MVYLPVEELEADASILISVSKRRFKRAVKRNRVKRQIREAYRVNKHELLNVLAEKAVPTGYRLYLSLRSAGGICRDRGEGKDGFGAADRRESGGTRCGCSGNPSEAMKRLFSYLLLLPIYFYRGSAFHP